MCGEMGGEEGWSEVPFGYHAQLHSRFKLVKMHLESKIHEYVKRTTKEELRQKSS